MRTAIINSSGLVVDVIMAASDYVATNGNAAVVSDSGNIGDTYADNVFIPPAQDSNTIRTSFVASAQRMLDKVTGGRGTIVRCFVAGIPVPSDWQTYIAALRAIVNNTDTTNTTLPTQPEFPTGT